MAKRMDRGASEKKSWAQLVHDVKSVDDDIERAIGLLREKHGFSREMASSEIVRRLSFAAV